MKNRDLIIGAASNYTWDQLKYWVNSIRKTGFDGDVVIVGTNMSADTINKLSDAGVILSLYGTMTEAGDMVSPKSGAPHVERFFYLWNYLNQLEDGEYLNVVTTDTRDVIFQSNPIDWILENSGTSLLIASSEGMVYENEPWGNNNLLETFGPFFHNTLKKNTIYNVGTIGGEMQTVKGLLSLIFHLSINRPIQIVDQAVYNFILNTPPFNYDTLFTNNSDSWAIQLGTTIGAIESGKGDLGLMFKKNPSKYATIYEDNQPMIEDGVVKTIDGIPYSIVHQYDRVDGLREHIERIYG
jgi:hypothetical protein